MNASIDRAYDLDNGRQFVWVTVEGDEGEGDRFRRAAYVAAAFARKHSIDGKAARISAGGSFHGGRFEFRVCYSMAGVKA